MTYCRDIHDDYICTEASFHEGDHKAGDGTGRIIISWPNDNGSPAISEQDIQARNATGAPTRNSTLPTDPAERKKYPMATGLLDYFPDALAEVAHVSFVGNEQHNPGQPLHWNRRKSQDEADTVIRHMSQRGSRDIDGLRHSAKAAWRVLAMLQKEIEAEQENGNAQVGAK